MHTYKIIKLMGGLGNQMFQYAFGQVLKKRFNCEILYDKNYFDRIKTKKRKLSVRHYELDYFNNLDIKFATKKQIDDAQNSNFYFKLFLKLFKNNKKNIITESNPFIYDELLFENYNISYYQGFFQNTEYYSGIKEKLKKDFELQALDKNDTYNIHLLNKINKCENPIGIFIRRGDYEVLNWAITNDYYQKAVNYIRKNVSNPTFFVFGADDAENYIKNKLDIGYNFEHIGEKNTKRPKFFEFFRLMMACRHLILANSTFCWWPAYLSDYPGKITIAPSPWLPGEYDGIICDNWIKIDCQFDKTNFSI